MSDEDRLSLLDLIDRWHAHERDGDPEAGPARHALELRLAGLRGAVGGAVSYGSTDFAGHLRGFIDGVR